MAALAECGFPHAGGPTAKFTASSQQFWAGSPGSWADLLLMKRSSEAAVICDATTTAEHMGKGIFVTEGKLLTLAKRAPLMGKDLKPAGDEEVVRSFEPPAKGQVTTPKGPPDDG